MWGFLLSKIGLLLIFAVAGFAWWKGGQGERTGAAAVVVAWIVALAVQSLTAGYGQMVALTAVDGLLALAMLFIAFSYSSLWLGVAMVLQGGVLAVHSIALGGGLSSRDYFIALNLTSTAMLWAMVFATVGSWINRSRTEAKDAPSPPAALAGAA